jgi:hypothetical protein
MATNKEPKRKRYTNRFHRAALALGEMSAADRFQLMVEAGLMTPEEVDRALQRLAKGALPQESSGLTTPSDIKKR